MIKIKSPSASASTRSSSRTKTDLDRINKLSPPSIQVESNQEGQKKDKISSDERKMTDKSPNRKEMERKKQARGHQGRNGTGTSTKARRSRATGRTTTKTPRLRQERGRSWGATGIGNHVRSFRFGSSMCKGSEMACIVVHILFLGFGDVVMDHLGKR